MTSSWRFFLIITKMTYFHEIFKKYAGLLPLRISQFWFGLVLWYLTPLSKNISVISRRSVLSVEETGKPPQVAVSHRQTLSHNVVHRALSRIRIQTSKMICSDCISLNSVYSSIYSVILLSHDIIIFL